MENFVFPDEINTKLMKIYIDEHFLSPLITLKCSKLYVFLLQTSGKHTFLIWLLLKTFNYIYMCFGKYHDLLF